MKMFTSKRRMVRAAAEFCNLSLEFRHVEEVLALKDGGCAVLLVSAKLEEVTALANRLLVIYHGHIAGEVDPVRTTNEEIGLMMTGATTA